MAAAFASLLQGVDLSRLGPILAALSSDRPAGALESQLMGADGNTLRRDIATWITQLVPVSALVPEDAQRWRPLVRDAIQFIFARLSAPRLATKLVEQFELPLSTSPENRLIRLIARMPGLQKIGQVLARNRRLSPALRTALAELENGMSDVSAADVRANITTQLGARLEEYAVRVSPEVLSEASVSAVIRFTWKNPDRERQRAVFKVLKSYVREYYAEDMTLLQELGAFLAGRGKGYRFAIRSIDEMLTEVRILLEHELDFAREQATLAEAARMYRGSLAIRVPRVIPALCTAEITAMSEESGVKVTDAFRRSPIRRARIAEQVIEALIATPLFSGQEFSTFHADPHAGNLLYDEANRELVVLDWALAEQLALSSRRELILLAIMMLLGNHDGVRRAIHALRRRDIGRQRTAERIVDLSVAAFFAKFPEDRSPGVLDAMRLLDDIAMQGVHFAAPLFLFRKSLFTLDGVLRDVAGSEVRIDREIALQFLTRWAASFGLFYTPLTMKDFFSIEWNAVLYSAEALKRRLLGEGVTGPARDSLGSKPSPKKKSPPPAQSRRPKRTRRQPRPAASPSRLT
jgi:ubiquinone biosynthesis protein